MIDMRARVLFGVFFAIAVPAAGQQSFDFDDWVEDRIVERLGGDVSKATDGVVDEARVAAGTRSLSKQTEVPSTASNATTLVDTTDASDLIGLALNLAGLSGSSQNESGTDDTAAAATVSGYALFSALRGRDPLDPEHYCAENAQLFRMISGTLGFEEADGGDDRILAGAKVVVPFISRRNPCDSEDFRDVQEAVQNAAMQYAEIHGAIQEAFYSSAVTSGIDKERTDQGFTVFVNETLSDPDSFKEFLARLGPDELNRILTSTVSINPFAAVDAAAAKAVREFEQQPRFAVQVLTQQQEGGDNDEYSVTALLDLAELTIGEAKILKLPTGLKLVLNAGWEKSERTDSEGGGAAVGIEYALAKSSLVGRRPLRFGISTDGKWMSSREDEYRGQLKLTIPVLDGFELPISMSVANRTELVDEVEVRGLVGFTVDTARLVALGTNVVSVNDLLR